MVIEMSENYERIYEIASIHFEEYDYEEVEWFVSLWDDYDLSEILALLKFFKKK